MARKTHLAELQMAIMQVLWEQGQATVAEVRESLAPNRPLAHTTVATMLTKMERNGQVTRGTQGRVNVFRPAIKRETVERSMATDLAKRLFAGDLEQMVSHLLDARNVTPQELARLKDLIRRKEREMRDAD